MPASQTKPARIACDAMPMKKMFELSAVDPLDDVDVLALLSTANNGAVALATLRMA